MLIIAHFQRYRRCCKGVPFQHFYLVVLPFRKLIISDF